MAIFTRTDLEYDDTVTANDIPVDWTLISQGVHYITEPGFFSVTFADGNRLDFTGSFKYSDNNMPKSGVFHSMTFFIDEMQYVSITDFELTVKKYYDINHEHIPSILSEEVLSGRDHLTGGKSTDILHGEGGVDVLFGGAGFDAIWGGDGNDKLRGGLDGDDLYGGLGSDKFVFRSLSESTALYSDGDSRFAYEFDELFVFNGDLDRDAGYHDKIDLRTIDANVNESGNQAFKFGGIDNNPGVGEVSYYTDVGGQLFVMANNGDGDHRLKIYITGTSELHTGDFIL